MSVVKDVDLVLEAMPSSNDDDDDDVKVHRVKLLYGLWWV